MRSTVRTALATATAVGLLAIPVAATASDTTVSFTVASSGALAIDQDGVTTATLDDGGSPLSFDALTSDVVSGTLPETTVTDDRGTLLGAWTVAVVADGPWRNQSNTDVTVAASNARAYLDVDTLVNLATNLSLSATEAVITGAELQTVGVNNLASSYTLISGTSTLGNAEFSYTPAVDITVPAATPAGVYTAVVSQTIS